MTSLRKRIYVENLSGMCNPLQIFVLAYASHCPFGHEIVLGWPELDALHRGSPPPEPCSVDAMGSSAGTNLH
jgi:hypothetical protein